MYARGYIYLYYIYIDNHQVGCDVECIDRINLKQLCSWRIVPLAGERSKTSPRPRALACESPARGRLVRAAVRYCWPGCIVE